MIIRRLSTLSFFAVAACGIAACEKPKPPAQGVDAAAVARESAFNNLKEHILQQLATCESGSWGPLPRPLYGGRGAYHGRYQFSVRTFQTYTLRKDGTQLTAKEASEAAQDWHKSSELAWYVIYDLNEPWHWPLCSRKLGLPAQLQEARDLSHS